MELAQVKAKILALSRKQKILAGVGVSLILLALVGGFWFFSQKIGLGKLSKTLPKQTLAENVTLARTVSVEKATQDKYQPTLKLKLEKPKGQKLGKTFMITERIPKEFAQSTDELEFSLPPTQILEKDPLIVWGFDEIETGESVDVEYDISASEAASLMPSPLPEESPVPVQDVWSPFREAIINWTSGMIDTFEIIIKRKEPMDYQQAEKVYTETVTMLAGQAVAPEKPKEQRATVQTQSLSPSMTSGLKATISSDKKQVYLGDKLLLSASEVAACQIIEEILYAPTNDYFLVILGCYEDANDALLFKADGADKKKIATDWDFIDRTKVEWQPDGKAFIYQRINSCCISHEELINRAKQNPPEEGQVKYDVQTGEKTLIGPSSAKPTAMVSPSPAANPSPATGEDWQYPGYRAVDQSEEFLTIVRDALTKTGGQGRGFTELKDCSKRLNYFPPDLGPIALEEIHHWYRQQAQKYGWQFQEQNYATLEVPRLYLKGGQKLYITAFVYAQNPAIDLCWKE